MRDFFNTFWWKNIIYCSKSTVALLFIKIPLVTCYKTLYLCSDFQMRGIRKPHKNRVG